MRTTVYLRLILLYFLLSATFSCQKNDQEIVLLQNQFTIASVQKWFSETYQSSNNRSARNSAPKKEPIWNQAERTTLLNGEPCYLIPLKYELNQQISFSVDLKNQIPQQRDLHTNIYLLVKKSNINSYQG